jgi:hypothetical protein
MVPVCCSDPEVAVTVTVALIGWVCWPDEEPLPPQPETGAKPANVNKTKSTILSRFLRFQPNRKTAAANAASGANGADRRSSAPMVELAAMVSWVEAALPDGVTCCGLKLHVAPAGRPLHAKVTAELNPLAGVTVTVAVA